MTGELAAFIRSAPDGATIRLRPRATYRIEGTLIIENRRDLAIDGAGSTFIVSTDGAEATEGKIDRRALNWPRRRSHIVVRGGSGIALRNIRIEGPNLEGGPTNAAYVRALEGQHGIEFQGTRNSSVEGCTVRRTYGDLVAVVGDSHNITIRGCELTNSGRQGVMVDRGHQVIISRNTISDIGRSAIDLEPAVETWRVTSVSITGNTIGRANGAFLAALGRGVVNDVTVRGNVLRSQGMGIRVKSATVARRNWTIVDNRSDLIVGAGGAPLRFDRVDNVVVRGNHQKIASTQGRKAVEIVDARNVIVEGNDFPIHNTRIVPSRPPTGEQAAVVVNGTTVQQPYVLHAP